MPAPSETKRLCGPDNWISVLDDPKARAVRWATNIDRNNDPHWTKWHYTEGNGAFTACGRVVSLMSADGSPAEDEVDRINCRLCLGLMTSSLQ